MSRVGEWICKRWLALGLLGLCLVPAGPAPAAEPSERPNILFIYADDQTYRTLSCYPESYDWVETPNIDRLAERGVRFTHAYIGTWCMPSRATMLTGHHQHAVESMRMEGAYPGSAYDPAQCPFWPAEFRKQGYVTAQIGKWHTGTDVGYGRDWDYQIVWNRPKFPENAGVYYGPQMISVNGGEDTMTPGYSTDNYTQWAEEFLRGKGREEGKPWYLWLCYGAVHGPYIPADRHLDRYPDAEVPIPSDIYPPRPGKADWMQTFGHWKEGSDGQPHLRNPNGKTLKAVQQQYNQAVCALDEGVGRVMKTLEETGQLDNTLVIYTADQGFGWGYHGMANKQAPYDDAIRAPMIVSMPGRLPEGAVCRTAIAGVDIPPTIYRFAGLELPWEMHGRDLTPLLEKPDASHPDHLSLTVFTGRTYGSDTAPLPSDGPSDNGIPWYAMVVKGQYKYIRYLSPGQIEELYDHDQDPDELTNVAGHPEYARTLAELREATVAELKRTKAPFVDSMPPPARPRK